MERLLGMLERSDYTPVTRTRLRDALVELGVRANGVLMVHVRMSALGWMAGGIDAIVCALQDTVGSGGTLLALTGWEDSPYNVATWPASWQQSYRDRPGFDPAVSSARREFGRFPERLRTWPGALRSPHPEVSFTAVGPAAGDLLNDPVDDDPWGVHGPLGRLAAADGQVLMLGAPLSRLTLCHHAEAVARIGNKRYHQYTAPICTSAGIEWRTYRTLDTFFGTEAYWEHPEFRDVDSWVGTMAESVVAAGATTHGQLDDCPLVLVDAPRAVAAVAEWLERTFASVD